MEQENYVIEMQNITKVFPGIKANDDITLKLKRGEIHALLGENGAGKSTLMSVLFGLYQPDGGQIYKDGKPVQIKNPNDATALGIGMVHQHFKLVECFTVLDNIILGDENSRFGFVSKKEARKKAQALSDKYGLKVDLDAKISDISVGMQQRTEILKMLFRDNEILIFDEPTAVLTPQEIEELMQIMRFLASEGKSILFISHKLKEIMEISDTCTVLRKGRLVGTVKTKGQTMESLATMMVGRNVSFHIEKKPSNPGKTVLKLNNLYVKNKITKKETVKNVSVSIPEGQIVCIAGIEGNGQTELVNAITGLEPAESGSVFLNGKDITHSSIRKKIAEGMSHIPEDRQKHGLILDYTLEENAVIERYRHKRFQRHGWISFQARKEYSDYLIGAYDIRSSLGSKTLVRSMSGGNQQKAIVGRELDKEHNLLIAVQPTRGLDVGAIEDIHRKIIADRDAGNAVLLVSLELDEVMDLSDIIYVMYEGELVGKFDAKKTTVEELGLYMAGAKRMDLTKGDTDHE